MGPTCYNFCQELDARRIALAERSLTHGAKEARTSLLATRKEFDEAAELGKTALWGKHRRLEVD